MLLESWDVISEIMRRCLLPASILPPVRLELGPAQHAVAPWWSHASQSTEDIVRVYIRDCNRFRINLCKPVQLCICNTCERAGYNLAGRWRNISNCMSSVVVHPHLGRILDIWATHYPSPVFWPERCPMWPWSNQATGKGATRFSAELAVVNHPSRPPLPVRPPPSPSFLFCLNLRVRAELDAAYCGRG